MHGLALDIEGGNTNPGARVAPFNKHGGNNQQWYDDQSTGTIRSVLNNFCLDIEGDQMLRLMPYQPGDPNQQWVREPNGYIRNKANGKVIDILNQDKNPGARVGMWEANGGPNQLWNFEPVGGVGAAQPSYGGQQTYPSSQPVTQSPSRKFQIVSLMHGKLLDVRGGNTSPGAEVIMYDRHNPPTNNQLFYTDAQGYIRSALNDFAIDAASGQPIKLQPFNGGPSQQWVLDGKAIRNRSNREVLDISGGKHDNGAQVLSYREHGNNNQQWRFDYV